MSATFFIRLDDKFCKIWIASNGSSNLANMICTNKYDPAYADRAEKILQDRQAMTADLEARMIENTTLMRKKFGWTVFPQKRIFLLTMDDPFYDYQLEHLKKIGASYYSSKGDHSDDKFGNDEMTSVTMQRYLATEPQKIGFSAE